MQYFFQKLPLRPLVRFRGSLLLFAGIFACMVGCKGPQSKPQIKLMSQLERQLDQSNQQLTAYHKSVLDLQQEGSISEDTTYLNLQNSSISEDNLTSDSPSPLLTDLAYATEVYFGDPNMIDRYDVSQQGDTLIALLNPEADPKTPLKRQEIIRGADSTIHYLRSQIYRKTILYEFSVDVAVQFDSLGLYTQHQSTIKNRMRIGRAAFHASITGKADY